MKILIMLFMSTVFIINVKAELNMSKIFSDNMVLQRDIPVPIWGRASPGDKVTVRFKEQIKETIAASDGKWILRLDPLKVSLVPDRMMITTHSTQKSFSNILVGDVWLCSGQSNMADHFAYALDSPYPPGGEIAAELAKIDNPLVRFIDENGVGKINPLPDAAPTFPYSHWRECSSRTARRFSRTAWYFGDMLQRELKIPIGLVNVSCGSSSIESWMPPEAFAARAEWKGYLDELNVFQDFYRNYQKYSDREKESVLLDYCNGVYGGFVKRVYMQNGTLPRERYDGVLTNMLAVKPASLYHHAIQPIIPFAFKGVIWYQGETNVLAGDREYTAKQQALIESWRKLWGQGNFPFYIVQLAPCLDAKNAALPEFWIQQYKAVRQTSKSRLIATVDIGDASEYHPKNKWDVGYRLARLALYETYGKKTLIASGPTYRSQDIKGNKVAVDFDNTGSGLTTRDGKTLAEFEIAGADKKFVKADASLENDKVIVTHPSIEKPLYVRYAWNNDPHPNLCNKEGLPVFPFNTAEPFFSCRF
jgi:sialate O-acetylesterase